MLKNVWWAIFSYKKLHKLNNQKYVICCKGSGPRNLLSIFHFTKQTCTCNFSITFINKKLNCRSQAKKGITKLYYIISCDPHSVHTYLDHFQGTMEADFLFEPYINTTKKYFFFK